MNVLWAEYYAETGSVSVKEVTVPYFQWRCKYERCGECKRMHLKYMCPGECSIMIPQVEVVEAAG